jgi:anti-sigma factor RsiW
MVASICVWARDQLEALVDGELDGAQAARLRLHLSECSDCSAHHAEATSLPGRLAVIRGPEPSPALLAGVLRRIRADRVTPLQLWGPLGVELGLFLVALWYMSGPGGLVVLVQRTASDLGALAGWGSGQATLPVAPPGDVFLLIVFGLLVLTSIYHLALLSRQGGRPGIGRVDPGLSVDPGRWPGGSPPQ